MTQINVTMVHSCNKTLWDTSRDIIDTETYHVIQTVIACVICPIITMVGFPCNMLCCLVFFRQGLKDRINICLFSLSLVDLCSITMWFLMSTYCFLKLAPADSLPFPASFWKWSVRKYIRGVHHSFLYASGCLTMVIAVERCICVTLPLKASKLLSARAMAILVVSIVVLVQLVGITYLFKYNVVLVYNNATGKHCVVMPKPQFYLQNKKLLDFLETVILMAVIPILTLIVVATATIITVIKLQKHMKLKKNMPRSSNRSEIRLVKMLMMVSVFYIITNSPVIPLFICRLTIPEFWVTGQSQTAFNSAQPTEKMMAHAHRQSRGSQNHSVSPASSRSAKLLRVGQDEEDFMFQSLTFLPIVPQAAIAASAQEQQTDETSLCGDQSSPSLAAQASRNTRHVDTFSDEQDQSFASKDAGSATDRDSLRSSVSVNDIDVEGTPNYSEDNSYAELFSVLHSAA